MEHAPVLQAPAPAAPLPEAPFFADLAEGPPGGRAVWCRAADGARLRVGLWAAEGAARGTVLLFPGRTEYVEKYGPTAADLGRRGYATATIDWRGQGLADRPLADPLTGHVDRFTDYQRDVAALLATVRAAGLPGPLYLLAHSMGGCIGLRALHDGLPVRAAAFTGPMWGIRLSALVRPVAWTVAHAARRLGQGHRYAPGTGPGTYVMANGAPGNALTSDAGMFAFMQRQIAARPELALGGPSLHWLHEALRETRALRRMLPPALPCLTALGAEESIVDAKAIAAVMARWPGGTLHRFPGARHEILMERPEIRRAFLDAATALFAAAA